MLLRSYCVSLEGRAMTHYHIRWSDRKLDWEAFSTPKEAEVSAMQLARQSETYTIEEFDGDCPRCAMLKKQRLVRSEVQGG